MRTHRLWKILVPAALAACTLGSALVAQESAPPDPPKRPARPEKVFHNDDRYKALTPASSMVNDPTRRGQVQRQVRQTLTGDLALSENRAFDVFYTQYLFPMMTLTDEAELADLTKNRGLFLRDHLAYCTNPDVHQHLVDLTFAEMKKIASDNFHPAVRYNAMYIISQLNTQEPSRVGANRAIPDPYSPALPWMLDEFKKEETPEALKVAALLGIIRHLEMDIYRTADRKIPAAQRADVIATLTTLAQTATPPAGRSLAAQNWLRRRALEGIAHAGFLNPEPNLVKLVTDLIANDKEVLAVRVDAAQSLGKMNLNPPVKVEVAATAESLVRLAMASVQSELARLDDLQKQDQERVRVLGGSGMQGGAMLGAGGGMMNPMPGMSGRRPGKGSELPPPEDFKKYRAELSMRRVRAYLNAIETAVLGADHDRFVRRHEKVELSSGGAKPVRGLSNIAKTPAEKDLLKGIVTMEGNSLRGSLVDLEKAMEEHEPDHYTFKQGVKDPMRELAQVVKVNPPPAAAPPADGAPDDGLDLPPAAPAKPPMGKAPPAAAPAAAEEPVVAEPGAKPAPAKPAPAAIDDAIGEEPAAAPAKPVPAKAPPAAAEEAP
jgi:hypothetical protein